MSVGAYFTKTYRFDLGCDPFATSPIEETDSSGVTALVDWFVAPIVEGLHAVHAVEERRFQRIRLELLEEMRKRSPERITRWWNR